MKLIILEGGDNLGKSTLIEGICRHFNYDNVIIRHFGKPPKNLSPQDSLNFQFNAFDNEYRLVEAISKHKSSYYEDIVIWNRAHLGEYVYAQMFRGADPKDIKSKLLDWEEFMLLSNEFDIYLITLTADPEFFFNNEDGNSFSKSLEEKTTELNLFKQAHYFSLIPNKVMIKVDKDGKFKSKRTILNYVLKFIK